MRVEPIISPRAKTPDQSGWVLFGLDMTAVILSLLAAVYLRFFYDSSLLWDVYAPTWPIVFLFPVVYALAGLYPGVGLTPPEEIRRLTYSTSLVFILMGASTFMGRSGADYSRGAFVFAWGLMLVSVPLARALGRELWSRKPWWGVPVFVIGAGETGRRMVRSLQRNPGLGLKPVAVFDDDERKRQEDVYGVPVVGTLHQAEEAAIRLGVRHVIMAMPGVPRSRLIELLANYGKVFPNLILIPDLFGVSSLWVSARDLGGVLGLEVKQRLIMSGPKFAKRLMDLTLVLLASPLIVLLCAIVALWVKLDSPGPIVFTQIRPGLGGNRFKIYKFRSMYVDAQERMKALPKHLQDEFRLYGKIQNDPRVTRAGYWLRKLSLDELPQFWNVLRGDMSLVGPRAYLVEQLDQMGDLQDTIFSVMPGLTGLWQVSGRSEVTFRERLEMDSYYVRNWSPWLDLYIVARTFWVLLFRRGAY